MKKLILVESPTKIKTLKKFLKDFLFGSTRGHIKDLPEKKIGVEIDKKKEIQITYDVMKGKEKVISEIKKLAKEADVIYLASDPDREGEIISLHAKEVIESIRGKKNFTIKRITFNEITKKAVLESLNNPREIDFNLVNAQQARRILDRWVGYKVSPILSRKISKGLSAGRVQSVSLKLICNREEEIRNFKIEEYWTIHGDFEIGKNKLVSDLVKVNGKKFDSCPKEDLSKILKNLKNQIWKLSEIKDSKKKRNPLAPFITSSLQQSAYNNLGFNVQQTMILAQKLYEGISIDGNQQALITYMRTDSTRISEEALKDARNFIEKEFGEKYLPEKANIYTKKNVQDAHEAIRPIDINLKPIDLKNHLEKEIYQLYELIWNRFISSQMNPAEYSNRQIFFENENKEFVFRASGSTLIFDGFLKLFNSKSEDEEDEKEKKLPSDLKENEKADLKKIEEKQHFTQPPTRYSEGSLVKELENRKIGRPGTYASILRTIRDRLYTFLDEKKRFVPTDLGELVTKTLEANVPEIMNISFTADMEEKLDLIAQEKEKRDDVLVKFYEHFEKQLEKFQGEKIDKNIELTNVKCEREGCSGNLRIKFGKNGQFLGCENFPECNFTANFKKNENGEIQILKIEKFEPEILDEKCENCGKNLILRIGKFGKFIACSGYPECKYIAKQRSKEFCPECKKEKLIKKIWKGQTFWGCEGYPNCKYSINGDILEEACEKCNFPFLQKKKDGSIICASKDCDFKKD